MAWGRKRPSKAIVPAPYRLVVPPCAVTVRCGPIAAPIQPSSITNCVTTTPSSLRILDERLGRDVDRLLLREDLREDAAEGNLRAGVHPRADQLHDAVAGQIDACGPARPAGRSADLEILPLPRSLAQPGDRQRDLQAAVVAADVDRILGGEGDLHVLLVRIDRLGLEAMEPLGKPLAKPGQIEGLGRPTRAAPARC